MKNILIMGAGRAGKTTLSNMLKEKYNQYSLIHSDSIKWAMIRAKGQEQYYRTNIVEQKEFECSEFFQKVLLEFLNSCIRKDDHKYGYILESGQLRAEHVKEMIDFENTLVVCLGHGDLTKEDIIDLCRENDKEEDWSYNLEYEFLEKHAAVWHEMNEEFKTECPKYGIPYYDTSKNRHKVLNEILEEISRKVE